MRTMQALNNRGVHVLSLAMIGLRVLMAADLASAEPAASSTRGPQLVPGLVGKAFLVDSIERAFSFRTGDTFHPACGTVEFWVQPQREIGQEDFEGTLYQTTDSLSATEGVQILFNRKGIEARTRNATCRASWGSDLWVPVHFAAGTWHHVALTWNGTTGQFYVDGKLAGQFAMKPMKSCFGRTYVGAVASPEKKSISRSAFDELRVSNGELSAEEIHRDFEAGQQHRPLAAETGRTLLVQHCDELPAVRTCTATMQVRVQPCADGQPQPDPNPIDALGMTDWFQAQWPSDPSMPIPKFPVFHVRPLSMMDAGVTLSRSFPINQELREPSVRLSLETPDGKTPLFTGLGSYTSRQVAYRVGNLLRLVEMAPPVERTVEMMVVSHRLVLMRIKLFGKADCRVRMDIDWESEGGDAPASNRPCTVPGALGWCGFEFLPGVAPGETFFAAVYDAATPAVVRAELDAARSKSKRFDTLWGELARPHAIEPFLTGDESAVERDLVAALVNQVLRNARAGGDVPAPSLLEFYGSWWNGDGVWICFQPACRYALWIEPSFWANSMRALFDHQAPDGRVPQAVTRLYADYPVSQIPNISSVLHDYYRFTGDRQFLQYSYPKLKKWYAWFLSKRNPTGDGIIAVGDPSLKLYDSICEYKDDYTDPTSPTFWDTCNPLTRTTEIGGRPERVYLPDIVACQARMAEDLAMMAQELGFKEDARHFTAEYHRIRGWANRTLWDEKTHFYYPVGGRAARS